MKKIISSILVFALLLTFVPVSFAATDFMVTLETSVETVAPGETFDVTAYISNATGGDVTCGLIQVEFMIPDGYTGVVKSQDAAEVSIKNGNKVVFIKDVDGGAVYNNSTPLGTVTLTAPATEGECNLTFSKIELYDADYVDYDSSTIGSTGAVVTVAEATGGDEGDDVVVPELPEGYNFYVTFDPAVAEVDLGASFDVTAYIAGPDGAAVTCGLIQVEFMIPDGFTGVVKSQDAAEVSIKNGNKVVFIKDVDGGAEYDANTALGTVTLTAPSTAGSYNLTFSKIELYDADYVDYSTDEIYGSTASITVGTGEPTPDPVKSLVVEPAAITVPYAEQGDVAAYIKSKITSATYFVDETGTDVLADITVDANGLVTYEDTSFQIEVTLAPAPVITGITVSGVEAITVGYGEDADTVIAEALAGATVTVAYDSIPAATVTDYTTNYDGTNVVIGYAGTDETATIPVTVITATGLELTPASVVVPYAGDVVEYVKANVDVKVVLSDDTKVAPLGEITYTLNETTVTVEADGLSADVAFTMGANPDEIVSIEADVAEVAVPYANKDAVEAYIAANVVITATKNVGTEVVGITAENVVAAEGVATITVAGVSTTVNYTVEEITGIVVTPETLDVPYTVEDIVAFVAESIDVYYVYSADTANSEVAAEDVEITVEGEVATIKVGEYEAVEVALNIEPTPDYIEENVTETENGDSVYALPGFRVVVINMNVDGVPSVDGKPALKIADKKFAVVTDAVAPVITVDTEATAEIVAWGRLHRDDMVTALDALIAINAADGVIAAELSADVNTYIKADLDGDYEITAADALKINNISLGKN